MNFLYALLGIKTKTLESIVSGITAQINELRELSKLKQQEASDHAAEMVKAKEKQEAAHALSNNASSIADSLANLISAPKETTLLEIKKDIK